MAKGYSLLIGVREVNPEHYRGWRGILTQPENDATIVQKKAEEKGFVTSTLLTKQATRDNVLNHIRKAAEFLEKDDIFFLFYSGHGGRVPDDDPDKCEEDKEEDGKNETWCLYDGQLIDDELYALWPDFKEGVRVFVVSDSCHSGTMTKSSIDLWDEDSEISRLIPKNMPDYYIEKVYDDNRHFYKQIYEKLSKLEKREINVSVISFGSCQDNQSSYALSGSEYSLFTNVFKDINNGNYTDVMKLISEKVQSIVGIMQQPNFYKIGIEESFEHQQLLEI